MGSVEVYEATGTFYDCNLSVEWPSWTCSTTCRLSLRVCPLVIAFRLGSFVGSFNLYIWYFVLFPLFCIFSPVTASSYSPLVPNLYSIQLASRTENPSSRQFMSSIPAPPDANGNPLIALAVAVIYAILYVLQGVRYGVSLITIGIPR